MVVADDDLLILLYHAALDASDGDAPDVVVVVDGGDEHLQRAVVVIRGLGNVFEYRVEKRLEVCAHDLRREGRRALPRGAEEHRAVELVVGGVQVDQQLEYLVDDLVDAPVGPVYLVDDDDDAVPELQRALKHEARLRHRALRGVDEQDDAVDHLEYALDLASEIGVAGGVDDIDLHAAVGNGGVFREYRYAALALEVAGVHDALLDRLVFAENAALLEHFVDEGGLAVVDVGDYRDVAYVFHAFTSCGLRCFTRARRRRCKADNKCPSARSGPCACRAR